MYLGSLEGQFLPPSLSPEAEGLPMVDPGQLSGQLLLFELTAGLQAARGLTVNRVHACGYVCRSKDGSQGCEVTVIP